MNTPNSKSPGVIRKAMATLKQQSDSHQSALDTLQTMKLALVEEFEALKIRYPAEIAKLDQKIAIFKQELADSKAAALDFERLLTEPDK